ncbi:arginine--tRNA ligase [Candidatus Gracilibacteria bacterium]|nr:arginine--tRNA ligase [Candidatus Gracilibacteria bacterium]
MLTSIISAHTSALYPNVSFSPILSAPPKSEHGEYCFGVFTLAKPLGKSPNQIAEEIATELRKDSIHFTQINTIGGYVNLSCTASVWMDILSQVENTRQESKNQTIVVDYIGANAGKPLHIGHICTPSIGQVICNIYRHLGYDVIGDSHFGDWGGIFGKLIYAWKYEEEITIFNKLDDLIKPELWAQLSLEIKNKPRSEKFEILLQDLGVDFILALYRSFHQIVLKEGIIVDGSEEIKQKETLAREEFQKLSQGDSENAELWKRFTAISVIEIEKKLSILEIKATYNIGESFYEGLDLPRPNNELYPLLNGENGDKKCTMKDIVAELTGKGIATDNSILTNGEDKSMGVVFPEETKIPSCVLQKKDGTGLYLTSDLAAIKYRMTNGWNPSKIIYCVDVRQQLHLRQVFWIAKKAWGLEDVELFHAFNGFIKLKEGAMSTRHGTVILLEALITEGKERTNKLLEEKGRTGDNALSPSDIEAITIGAIKYSYLSQDREKDVTFDWDKALAFEGNSGPYIQYACVRAQKIVGTIAKKEYDFSQIQGLSLHDTVLIRTLAEMESKIQITADTYKPHTLALYAYNLAVCFNSFYVHTPKILEESDANMKSLRITLCRLTAEKLTLAFDLLAIRMPNEM